jgi:predicted glycosyltransferase
VTVAVYCQHVLGMGHLFRTLGILAALAGHERWLFLGGPDVPAAVPDGVTVVRLPALSMDEDFSSLSLAGRDLEAVKAARRELLWETFDRIRPEVFFVELYPFGRKAFEFELAPLLAAIRQGRFGLCRVVCGVRDILVEKKDQAAYEARVIDRLSAYFDAVLVQADPTLVVLEATFSRVADIPVPVRYTGYVVAGPGPARSREVVRGALGVEVGRELVVVSAGGGRVGFEVPLAVLAACREHPRLSRAAVRVFAGPYAPADAYAAMAARAAALPDARVTRFAAGFADILAAADLSVSLAGYNTVMGLLAAGTRALVVPFDQNREQRLRAELLAKRGLLGLLEAADLDPGRLASRLVAALAGPAPPPGGVDLSGAGRTAEALEALARCPAPSRSSARRHFPHRS